MITVWLYTKQAETFYRSCDNSKLWVPLKHRRHSVDSELFQSIVWKTVSVYQTSFIQQGTLIAPKL